MQAFTVSATSEILELRGKNNLAAFCHLISQRSKNTPKNTQQTEKQQNTDKPSKVSNLKMSKTFQELKMEKMMIHTLEGVLSVKSGNCDLFMVSNSAKG